MFETIPPEGIVRKQVSGGGYPGALQVSRSPDRQPGLGPGAAGKAQGERLGAGLDRDSGKGDRRTRRSSAARFDDTSVSSLPALPVLPRLQIDGHYLAAESPRSAGGPWFDVMALADGRAVMFVGHTAAGDIEPGKAAVNPEPDDLALRGSETPSATGQFRMGLARLLADDDLAAVLDRVEGEFNGGEVAGPSTVCVAVIDPLDGQVDYSTYGHPPPLVVAPGNTRYLPTVGASLGRRLALPNVTARLDPGEVLVLHSNGLGAESRRAVAQCLAEAIRNTEAGGSPSLASMHRTVGTDSLCRTTTAELRRCGSHDALAVLAVQHRPETSRLAMTVPAVQKSLEAVDRTVGDWLSGLRSSVEDGVGVALAVGEAVTNAIQHAFVGQRVGSVRVEAELQKDGILAFSVHDNGCWLPPESSRTGRSGRGLSMIARLCDRMVVHRETTGTVIELRRRLHHPVVRAAAAAPRK